MPPFKRIYWDTCIFLAWIKDEPRKDHEMDGIYECVEDLEKGRVRIFTSVATVQEIFRSRMDQNAQNKYSDIMNRRDVQFIPTDLRVSEKASEIRDFFNSINRTDHLGKIEDNDAVHLATAIHYRADEFWTFDNGGHGGRSLLSLDGNVAGYPLKITKPWARQLYLGTGGLFPDSET